MKHANPRWPWLRYSVRGLLLLITVICVWLAIVFNQARRQRNAVRAITSAGGLVAFDYHFQQDRKDADPPGPAWLRRMVGDELFRTPQHVHMQGDQITDKFLAEHLPGLRGVQVLTIDSSAVSDAGLAEVARLPSINMLGVQCPRVTDAGLAHLATMVQLRTLSLECPQVTDAGMPHLARLGQLQRLQLIGPQITADGVKLLRPLKHLTSVASLHDPGNQTLSVLLRSRRDIELIDVPLLDAVEYLAHIHAVNIDVGDVPADQRTKTVHVVAQGQTLDATLSVMLRPVGLDYYLENEAIKIAPQAIAEPHRAGRRAFRETLPNLEELEVDW